MPSILLSIGYAFIRDFRIRIGLDTSEHLRCTQRTSISWQIRRMDCAREGRGVLGPLPLLLSGCVRTTFARSFLGALERLLLIYPHESSLGAACTLCLNRV